MQTEGTAKVGNRPNGAARGGWCVGRRGCNTCSSNIITADNRKKKEHIHISFFHCHSCIYIRDILDAKVSKRDSFTCTSFYSP